MTITCRNRILSLGLAILMVLSLVPLQALPAAATENTYTLDIADVEDVPQYSKADGDTLKCGTDGYFIICRWHLSYWRIDE